MLADQSAPALFVCSLLAWSHCVLTRTSSIEKHMALAASAELRSESGPLRRATKYSFPSMTGCACTRETSMVALKAPLKLRELWQTVAGAREMQMSTGHSGSYLQELILS